MNLSHFPLRVAIGAFFVNSGLSKWNLEGEAVTATHGMAVGAVPQLKRDRPGPLRQAARRYRTGAGWCPAAADRPVRAGLLRLYWATPGLREPGGFRPTQQGVAIAKDTWLVGAGLTLLLDDLLGRASGKRRALGMHFARSCGKRRG
jgi:hypothetical protein